jgi:PadR family transcriptional regulator PadR
MVRGRYPGEFEQVVLLALAGREDEASGRDVYDRILEMTQREISVAAVHITLNRLHKKGWALCRTGAPAPGEGGKPRRHYQIAPAGAGALAEQREQLERLWGRAATHPLLGSGE